MWEQLTRMFDCSNTYALHKLSNVHKPLRFQWLQYFVMYCISMWQGIYVHYYLFGLFKWCKYRCGVFFRGQLTLIHVAFLSRVVFVMHELVFLGKWRDGILSCPGLSFITGVQMSVMLGVLINLLVPTLADLSALMVPMSNVRIMWLNLCVTCFMVSSIISPWSGSNSELDWT